MLVIFQTRARYPDINMFGDVAKTLIRLLEAARVENVPVMWEADGRMF